MTVTTTNIFCQMRLLAHITALSQHTYTALAVKLIMLNVDEYFSIDHIIRSPGLVSNFMVESIYYL